MGKVIEEHELLKMSDGDLLEQIKDKGVLLYLHNGKMNEGRVSDIIVTKNNTSVIKFDVGLNTYRPTVKRIEILDDNCPKISI